MEAYSLTAITSLYDDLLYDWLILYETAFPPEERILIGDILKLIKKQEEGQADTHNLLALITGKGELVGMAMYELVPRLSAVYAWYLAIKPELRNRGLGSSFYQMILKDLWEKNYRVMIFEVEKPEEASIAAEANLRRRRIEFYRRNGAQQLEGVYYLQSVGDHCPPTPMHLMVHLREPLSAQQVYEIARDLFGDDVRQVAPLALR